MLLPPYIPAWPDLAPFVAELWLVVTVLAVLVTPFFVRKPNSVVGVVALIGLVGAIVSLVVVWPIRPIAGRFATMLVADPVATLWRLILLVFVFGVVLLWTSSGRHKTREGEGPEFLVLLLCATLGMALMGSAGNLLMILLSVELASLPSYVLAGFRKTGRLGSEASLKYVLFGAAASSVMIWGLSLIYGVCGTLSLLGSSVGQTPVLGIIDRLTASGTSSPLLLVGVLALVVGIAFKIAAVPFHLWCPDVFEGATTEVSAFLSVASKGAGLVLLLRVVSVFGLAKGGMGPLLSGLVGTLGILSMIVGNTAAYAQTDLKRLLAYSSIAHAGYMLCAIAVAVAVEASSAAGDALLFYLAVYLFMNLGAFAVVAAVGGPAGQPTLADLSGLSRRSPILAAAMTVCLLSLIGIPPFAGFTAKFNLMILLSGFGGWGWALLAAIGLNTILSAFYYFKFIRAMYLRDDLLPAMNSRFDLTRWISVIAALVLVVLFVGANGLSRLASLTHSPPAPSTDLRSR